jgi:hypothetical protein
MRKRTFLIVVLVLALALVGGGVAYVLAGQDRPQGELDTEVADVSLVVPTDAAATTAETGPSETETDTSPQVTTTGAAETQEGPCWPEFGGDPARTLARVDVHLGRPAKKPVWSGG